MGENALTAKSAEVLIFVNMGDNALHAKNVEALLPDSPFIMQPPVDKPPEKKTSMIVIDNVRISELTPDANKHTLGTSTSELRNPSPLSHDH